MTIIFTLVLSFGYAQHVDWDYQLTKPLKEVRMLTPAMIKEELRGTSWLRSVCVKWQVKNGTVWESEHIHLTHDLGKGERRAIRIGEDEIYQYKYSLWSDSEGVEIERTTLPYQQNRMFRVVVDNGWVSYECLYVCVEDFRRDGKEYRLYKYFPCHTEAVEQLEIFYCMENTHFAILDRVNYPPVKIADLVCPAPHNPDKRVELPFAKIGRAKYGRGKR